MIRAKQIRQTVILLTLISLILNLYFWTGAFSTSYVLSSVFQDTFWVLAPCVTLVAYSKIDSGSYLPSFKFDKIGLPWQLSYLTEKFIHLICCAIVSSSFLLLLSAFLISNAPVEYRTVRIAEIKQSRLFGYQYHWQISCEDPYLVGKDLPINRNLYRFLNHNRQRDIAIRIRHNLAGASVTIIK